MNDLAPISAGPTPLSQAAAEIVRQWTSGQDLGQQPTVPASVRLEALRKLPNLEAQIAGASAARWLAFLRPLANAVRNPPSDEGATTFAATCSTTLQDIPAALLTANAQREACRRFAFWPAVADLADWLSPEAAPVRREIATLRRIARAPVAALPAHVEQPADPAAMAALAASLRTPPDQSERAPPAGMRADQLAAHYEALGDRYASTGDTGRAQAMFDRANRIRSSVAA